MKALGLLTLLLASPAPAKERFDTFRFQFVDEAEREPEFAAFRKAFLDAVGHRDPKELLTMVDDKLQKPFAKKWELAGEAPRESRIWESLRETLALGGSFEKGVFIAPYVFSRWPQRYPQLEFLAVTVKKAVVREKPSESSRAVETLSHEIVGRYDDLPDPPLWRAVRTPSGRTGFLKSSESRSPADYRARFTRINGKWKLTSYSAGDSQRDSNREAQ